jgi:hypothetical protein
MSQYAAGLKWTDEQWDRVTRTVKQEAERTRVAAKLLPIYGPVNEDQLAVENFALGQQGAPLVPGPGLGLAVDRLAVDSAADTALASISMLVYVRTHEASDPELQAALTMFRRAANIIARTEDALMFNGQPRANDPPNVPGAPIALVQTTYGREQRGLVSSPITPQFGRGHPSVTINRGAAAAGVGVVTAIVNAITQLETDGYGPPYSCVLGNDLYREAHTPTNNLVLPRQPITSMLEGGPLLRSSLIPAGSGAVISHESGQVEQVVATEICAKFLHVSEEPRFVFRVAERVALRVRDWAAVVSIAP